MESWRGPVCRSVPGTCTYSAARSRRAIGRAHVCASLCFPPGAPIRAELKTVQGVGTNPKGLMKRSRRHGRFCDPSCEAQISARHGKRADQPSNFAHVLVIFLLAGAAFAFTAVAVSSSEP